MKLLIIDNYDSFTHNLAHYLEASHCEVDVCRVDLAPVAPWDSYEAMVLSPGPGLPEESPSLMRIIAESFGKMPILGVCLGLQGLAQFSGARLYNLKDVKHGLQREVLHNENGLFYGVSNPTKVGLYHSWAVEESSLSKGWKVVAKSTEGVVMAIEDLEHQVCAVQFHPESILSPEGRRILNNWLNQYVK